MNKFLSKAKKVENWETEFDKIWAEYPRNKKDNTKGLDFLIKDFISQLLKEKKENNQCK